MIKIVALAAALALTTPALAGIAPQAAPAVAETKSAEEAAFEARTEAFKARMTQMSTEFEAAVGDAGGDQTRGMAAIDAVLARYQPDIAAFLTDFDRFIDSQSANEPDDATRQGMDAARTAVRQSLEGLPDQMRAGARTAIASQVGPQ